MNNELFITATRKKYRFPFNGMISVEDLWDLNPAQLDKVYMDLKKEQKSDSGESLMTERTDADSIVDTKLELVKYIFDVKQAEKQAAIDKAEKDAKKKRIREIIASKKEAELEGMSIEELEKLLDK